MHERSPWDGWGDRQVLLGEGMHDARWMEWLHDIREEEMVFGYIIWNLYSILYLSIKSIFLFIVRAVYH